MSLTIHPEPVEIEAPDGIGRRWSISGEQRDYTVDVLISRTAHGSDPDQLVSQVGDAVRTLGRSALERIDSEDRIPAVIIVSTSTVTGVGRHSISEARPGEAVAVPHPHDDRWWVTGEVVRAGEPDEAQLVEDPRVERGRHGPGRRAGDVVLVRRDYDHAIIVLPYPQVRKRWSVL